MKNERYQGRHRPALTGMGTYFKWDKLLDMQPRQTIIQASQNIDFKTRASCAHEFHINRSMNHNNRLHLKVVTDLMYKISPERQKSSELAS